MIDSLLYFAFSFILFMMITYIIKLIRNERKRKLFTPKPGDQVRVPVYEEYSGEVLEVNGDEVKIVVTTSKNRVYPKNYEIHNKNIDGDLLLHKNRMNHLNFY